MKQNIIFIVIDSLRADRFFGKDRSCKTPNIDLLIKKGIYFQNTITSSDVTGVCLGNIFSGMYSFKTGMSTRKFNSNTNMIFNILKNNGYEIHGTIPNLTWFKLLTKNFDVKNYFKCIAEDPRKTSALLSKNKINEENNLSTDTETLFFKGFLDKNLIQDGLFKDLGKMIIDKLSSKNMNNPWFYYIHLMDLHQEINVPEMFDDIKFGKTKYDRVVSAIDFWIGKIIDKIDLENTLVVITSDHGDNIPVIDNIPGSIPKIQSKMRKGKEKMPFLEPIGIKFFIFFRYVAKFFQKRKLKELTKSQMRTLNTRGGKTLFDELLHVPLLLFGGNVSQPMIIKNMVSGVDILQTLLSMINVNHIDSNLDGRDLSPLFSGNSIKDIPIYIESGDTSDQKKGFLIGIRTSNYKYLRSRNNSSKNVSLYNILIDPFEKENISDKNAELISELENTLSEFILQNSQNNESNISSNDETEIANELKKLGYI